MSDMNANHDIEGELRRARIVIDNLQARIGALIGENIDLLIRLHDAETQPEDAS